MYYATIDVTWIIILFIALVIVFLLFNSCVTTEVIVWIIITFLVTALIFELPHYRIEIERCNDRLLPCKEEVRELKQTGNVEVICHQCLKQNKGEDKTVTKGPAKGKIFFEKY